jgi:hypothetical protein
MVRRPGDKSSEPPGGRAAERLRMFEQARQPDQSPTKVKSKEPTKRKAPLTRQEGKHAKQTRRKD